MAPTILGRSTETPSAPRSRRQSNAAWWLSFPLLFFLTFPLIAMMLRVVPADVAATLAEEKVQQAIWLSFTTTLITTFLTVLLGTPIALLLAKQQSRLRRLVDTLIDLPTVLPPSVAGVALLIAFGRRGILGAYLNDWGVSIAFTQTAVVLAQLFVAAPFYIRAATIGFSAIESELEEAAALDGGGKWEIFRYITIPLSWGALVSGAVMTWARALGEFGATIIFAGNYPGRTQTMPLAIYLGFELDLSTALTLSVILVGCSFLVLVITRTLLKRNA